MSWGTLLAGFGFGMFYAGGIAFGFAWGRHSASDVNSHQQEES